MTPPISTERARGILLAFQSLAVTEAAADIMAQAVATFDSLEDDAEVHLRLIATLDEQAKAFRRDGCLPARLRPLVAVQVTRGDDRETYIANSDEWNRNQDITIWLNAQITPQPEGSAE